MLAGNQMLRVGRVTARAAMRNESAFADEQELQLDTEEILSLCA